jgi:hypothetical protein
MYFALLVFGVATRCKLQGLQTHIAFRGAVFCTMYIKAISVCCKRKGVLKRALRAQHIHSKAQC